MKHIYIIFVMLISTFNVSSQADSLISNSLDKLSLAIINDTDNYTIIRRLPNIESDSISYVSTDELFRFIPNKTNDWLAIQTFWNVSGYIHKSKVEPINNLSDSLISLLSFKILSNELILVEKLSNFKQNQQVEAQKIGVEHNKYHDSYYRPILPYSVDFMIKSKNETHIMLFVDIVNNSTGSADETQAYEFARLFISLPDLMFEYINSLKSKLLNEYLINTFEYYYANKIINTSDTKYLEEKLNKLR